MSHRLTPDQAREQLATIHARTLDTSRDRAVHARAVIRWGTE